MRVRRALSVLLVVLFYLQPTTAYASTYSIMQYEYKLWPPGYSPPAASACEQAGMVDTAQNYSQAQERDWVDNSCSGSGHYIPAGYIGTKVTGYTGGSYCGESRFYYNTQTSFGWQLWITLCPNPSGVQGFASVATGTFWDGNGYWRTIVGPGAAGYY
jgi:hypothetical protein